MSSVVVSSSSNNNNNNPIMMNNKTIGSSSATTTTTTLSSCCIDGVNDSITQQVQITETIELIERSLQEFTIALDLIPNTDLTKQAYLDGCRINPQWVIYDQAFRLQFLRTEVYNVEAAVERYLRYWTNRKSLYNNNNDTKYWYKPYRLIDMSTEDYEALTWGYVQFVQGHERLYYINPANAPKIGQYNIDSLVRAIHYTNEQKLKSSDIAQRKGVVAIIDFKTIRWYDNKFMNRLSETFTNGFPSRTSMTCIINAPPGTGFFVSLLKQFVKYKLRPRFHIISSSKQCEQLLGITLEQLYKSLNHNQWIQQQRLIEEKQQQQEKQQEQFQQQQQQEKKQYPDNNSIPSITTTHNNKTILYDRKISSLSDSSSQQQQQEQQQLMITKQNNNNNNKTTKNSSLNKKFTIWSKQKDHQQQQLKQNQTPSQQSPILKCITLLSGEVIL